MNKKACFGVVLKQAFCLKGKGRADFGIPSDSFKELD